jgi:hypothetical protein
VPFLRVLRDKRGYETTYLMHWFRDGSRQRSRILYVFRTPPGVRVGRDPIDPEVVRELEARHPDIDFDWRALRENQQVVETSPEARRPRAPARGARRRDEEHGAKPAPPPAPQPSPAPKPPVPASIEGSTHEMQLAFLAKWYADLHERVPHRTQDPVRLAALMALVERLNPAPWSTEEQITEGLQHASEALGRLSRVLSKRRRRARRPRAAEPAAAAERSEQSERPDPSDPAE